MFKFIWKHNKLWLFLAIVNTILSAIFPLLNIIIPKYIIDSIFAAKDFNAAFFWIMMFALINCFIQYIVAIIQYNLSKQKNKLFCSFNLYMAELIMDMDYKELENPRTLDMKDRAVQSAFSGGNGFCGSVELFLGIITNVIILLGTAAKIFTINPLLVLLTLLIVILNTCFNSKTNKSNYRLDQDKIPIERENNYVFNLISDFSIGKEVRIYGLKQYILEKYKQTSEKSNTFYTKAFKNNTKNTIFTITTGNIQIFFVYFILVAQALKNEGFTYGDFTVHFNAVNAFSNAILAIVTSTLKICQQGFYIKDLEDFVMLPRMVNKQGKHIEKNTGLVFEFRNVSFKYPGAEDYSLRNITMKFSSEEKISFVGMNGAGKTTVIKLLLRLYNVDSGEILLNNKNINEYDWTEYINIFATVFQDFKLFAYSVKENIILDEGNGVKEKLDYAVEKSGVKEYIEKKRNGLDTYVYKIFDETGFEPSGGEGQKIAIARALYKNAEFIILDEPASALDPLSEYDLYTNLNNLVNSKGCIFISHRLSSTVFADKIFVFNNGYLEESGSHSELMKNENGLYKEMFEKQSSYYKE